jgi:RimJ/RimL family protein N-acetyltransferase
VDLVNVYRVKAAPRILYDLLAERPAYANISHRKMPTVRQHGAFIRSRPYRCWYLIRHEAAYVGSIYLSRSDEIGVFIFARYRGQRLGPRAIELLMRKHPRRRYLANIAPGNKGSIRMFGRLGFRLIQHTYELGA